MNLLEHQKKSLDHLQGWRVGALFMEAGTGKTRVAAKLIERVDSDMVLYICPLRLIESTKIELRKWGVDLNKFIFKGAESIGQSDRIYLEIREIISKVQNLFMIVDESLKIKNSRAIRTTRILDLGQFAKYKLILNGTPLTKNLLDLYPQMKFLSPQILNMSESQFKNTFCKYTTITKIIGRKRNTKEFITGYENIDYLYSLIWSYIYECDLELNISQNYKIINYKIGSEAKEEYNRIKELYLDDETLQWKNNNIFLEMTSKMQHSYCCDEAKIKALEQLFNIEEKSKIIVFCKFIVSRELLQKLHPDLKVLSYQKEAFGLNLQDYNVTVYFDKTWDLATRTQASRRTYRTGQSIDCRYYDMTGDVGLEKLIDLNIIKKVNMVEYFKSKTKEQIKQEL